jgi:hypothetical protein
MAFTFAISNPAFINAFDYRESLVIFYARMRIRFSRMRVIRKTRHPSGAITNLSSVLTIHETKYYRLPLHE